MIFATPLSEMIPAALHILGPMTGAGVAVATTCMTRPVAGSVAVTSSMDVTCSVLVTVTTMIAPGAVDVVCRPGTIDVWVAKMVAVVGVAMQEHALDMREDAREASLGGS